MWSTYRNLYICGQHINNRTKTKTKNVSLQKQFNKKMANEKQQPQTTGKAIKFQKWNSESRKNEKSEEILGVYIKEIPKKDGSGTFKTIDVVTSTGTHTAFLNDIDKNKAELKRRVNQMTEEQVLKALEA